MSTSGNKRCGAPGGCTGLSSFGDLKVQWINAGNINKDKEERLPLGKEERTKTPWLLATEYHPGPLCAGVIKGITYYQMYKCIPSSSNGSHFYSLTLSNLGQFPEIQVFVDQYDDPACSKCTTCGTISTLVTIPSGLLNACSSGVSFSTVLLQNVFPNVETVPVRPVPLPLSLFPLPSPHLSSPLPATNTLFVPHLLISHPKFCFII